MVNQFVVEFASYTLLAFILSTKSVSEKYLAAKAWLDRFAALVLGGLGPAFAVAEVTSCQGRFPA